MNNKEEFERKARCVATAWEALEGQEGWDAVIKKFDLGFPYAWLVYIKHGTLNKEGKKLVVDTYDFLIKALDLPETDYDSYWDMDRAFGAKS